MSTDSVCHLNPPFDFTNFGMKEAIYLPPKKLTYVHIYKAGGSSISYALRSIGPTMCITDHRSCGYEDGNKQGLKPARMIGIHHPSNFKHLNDSAVFSVMRDPILRFESSLRQLIFLKRLSNSTSCGHLVRLVQRQGFFDSHLYPQISFLSHNKKLIHNITVFPSIEHLQRCGTIDRVPSLHVLPTNQLQKCSQHARSIIELYKTDAHLYNCLLRSPCGAVVS